MQAGDIAEVQQKKEMDVVSIATTAAPAPARLFPSTESFRAIPLPASS